MATVSVDNLSETASVLLNVSHVAEEQALELTSELNHAKAEMAALNEKLKLTQQSLLVKEQMLSDTVIQLQSAQSSLNITTQNCNSTIKSVASQLSTAQSLLPTDNVITLHNTEIAKLRAENLSMSTSIQKLESTVVQLTGNFRALTQTNKAQLAEIDTLRSENKHLQQAITALTNALENQNSGGSVQQQNSVGLKLKMFGNT